MKFTKLRKRAIEKVKELSQTSLPIEEIARKTGFSTSYVYKLIRKMREEECQQKN